MLTFGQGMYSGNISQVKTQKGILACLTDYNSDNYNNSVHCHENAHFSFMIQGGCVERKKEAFEITPGSITYYSSGEMHQVVKIVELSRRVNLELEENLFNEFNFNDAQARTAITQNPEAKFLMVKVYKELLTNDSLSGVSVQMLLLQLIGQEQCDQETKLPGWTGSINDYLHQNSDENISLHQMALIANLHPVTLSKYFPKYFHCTIGEYKRKLKIEKSLALIKSTKLSLCQIALKCGFYDQNHFIRTFKNATGFLPLEYRKS